MALTDNVEPSSMLNRRFTSSPAIRAVEAGVGGAMLETAGSSDIDSSL
jgi:hypothetical protein